MENQRINFTWDLKQRIIHQIMLKAYLCKEPGLLNGKMGIVIAFYILSEKTSNSVYADFAGDLLDDILDNLHKGISADFESGLSGIGWGIEYLIQNNFVDANSLEVCKEINERIMLTDIRRVCDYSLEKGLSGLLHYIMIHLKGCYIQKNNIPFDRIYLMDVYGKIKSLNDKSSKDKKYSLISDYIKFINEGVVEYNYEIENIITKCKKINPAKIHIYPLGIKKGLSTFIFG